MPAQTVRGFVRDSTSHEPIAGAVVSALDSNGKAFARVVTDARGHYHLPSFGTQRLQALRIGFRPRTVRVPLSTQDQDVDLDISMTALPRLLDRVVVTDVARCRSSDDQGVALALWQQARAALLANAVARADSADTHTVRFERTVNPVSGEVTRLAFRRMGGHRISPFIAAYPASEFAVRGYMSEDSSGRTFNAPDADVLLDPSFADTHCFGVRSDAAHQQQVGLSFRPEKDDDEIVDVTGTLWMDTERPALRSLEFAYTSLEPAAIDAHSGGIISFREMRPGVVFIDRWSIRMGLLGVDLHNVPRSPSPLRTRRVEMQLTGIHESGGEVVSISWIDGITWTNDLGRIAGRVVETSSHKPVAGVQVLLRLSPDTVTTDSLGHFLFRDLVPGPYVLEATDTAAASFGLAEHQVRAVRVERSATTDGSLTWKPLQDRVREYCRARNRSVRDTSQVGTILGRVLLPDGSPATGATLDARPLAASERAGRNGVQVGRMSEHPERLERGTFVSCYVDRGTPMYYRIAHPRADTTNTRVQLAADEPLRELVIRLNAIGSSGPSSKNPAGVRQRVDRNLDEVVSVFTRRSTVCQEPGKESLILSHPLHLDGNRVDGILQPRQVRLRRVAHRSRGLLGNPLIFDRLEERRSCVGEHRYPRATCLGQYLFVSNKYSDCTGNDHFVIRRTFMCLSDGTQPSLPPDTTPEAGYGGRQKFVDVPIRRLVSSMSLLENRHGQPLARQEARYLSRKRETRTEWPESPGGFRGRRI